MGVHQRAIKGCVGVGTCDRQRYQAIDEEPCILIGTEEQISGVGYNAQNSTEDQKG